jgi:hypothetical protein
MEAMLGISLYSYPYFNLKKYCVSFVAYVFSSTKLEIRVEQVLPGSRSGGQRRQMAQTMYAHVNK